MKRALDVIEVCAILSSTRTSLDSEMGIKPTPNHLRYLQALRSMTPAQRLAKALELTELGRHLLADGLRQRHPGLPEAELRRLYLEQIARCHNRIY